MQASIKWNEMPEILLVLRFKIRIRKRLWVSEIHICIYILLPFGQRAESHRWQKHLRFKTGNSKSASSHDGPEKRTRGRKMKRKA